MGGPPMRTSQRTCLGAGLSVASPATREMPTRFGLSTAIPGRGIVVLNCH
ncbi:MAG: hypothetical protein J0L67_15580 [Cytophagales bacterium]|nr:hypothetical protein [Cytophagales bacterium]